MAYSDDKDEGYKDDNQKNIVRMKMPLGGFTVEPDPKNSSKSILKLIFEVNVGGDMPIQIMKQTLADQTNSLVILKSLIKPWLQQHG